MKVLYNPTSEEEKRHEDYAKLVCGSFDDDFLKETFGSSSFDIDGITF